MPEPRRTKPNRSRRRNNSRHPWAAKKIGASAVEPFSTYAQFRGNLFRQHDGRIDCPGLFSSTFQTFCPPAVAALPGCPLGVPNLCREVSVKLVDKKSMGGPEPPEAGRYGRSYGDAGGDPRPDGGGNRRLG